MAAVLVLQPVASTTRLRSALSIFRVIFIHTGYGKSWYSGNTKFRSCKHLKYTGCLRHSERPHGDPDSIRPDGFTRAQTDAKIAVAWPKERFDAAKAKKVLRFIEEAIGAFWSEHSTLNT
jgi:hypothetical protein